MSSNAGRSHKLRSGKQEVVDQVPQSMVGNDLPRVCRLSTLRADRFASVALLELDIGPYALRTN